MANTPLDAADAAPGKTTPDYILQPGDKLLVTVFQVEDLRAEVRISQENKIRLHLLGDVDLKGKTLREATNLVRDLYKKDYLVNPQVTITVTEYVKRYVNVYGQVGNAGAIEFPPEQGLTINQAITRAGGPTRLADLKKVTLTRVTEDGKSEKSTVNMEDIIAGKATDIPLQKDDTIRIPENLF